VPLEALNLGQHVADYRSRSLCLRDAVGVEPRVLRSDIGIIGQRIICVEKLLKSI